jgi:hypothetical protein
MTKRKQVSAFLWPRLRDQLAHTVNNRVWQEVSSKVRSNLEDNLWLNIYESLKNDQT